MTPEARAELAQLMVPWLKGTIRVSDGSQSATAPATAAINDAGELVVTAVFDERAANFHWTQRDVISAQGTVIDSHQEDYGEKTLGHVWTLEVPLEVAP
jgi:hypothetical protein